MELLSVYLLKLTLYVVVILSMYWCFFKNETFYLFNRCFLLIGLIAALLLPFYTYTYEIKMLLATDGLAIASPTQLVPENGNSWFIILFVVYISGLCFLLVRHIIGLIKIKQTISKYRYVNFNGCRLVETPVFKTSFSVFNYIIIDNSSEVSEVEKRLIIEHELAHIKQYHWVDLLLLQLFCAVQWFNPLVWLYLHIVKQNHEFLADQAVLQNGNSAAVYRAALINHSLGTPVFALASSFSHYDRLKRVKMMMRPASASIKKFAVVLVLPIVALILWAFSKPQILFEKTVDKQKLNVDVIQAVGIEKAKQPVKKSVLKEKKTVKVATKKVKPVLETEDVSNEAVSSLVQDSVLTKAKPLASGINTLGTVKKSNPVIYLDGIEVSSTDVIKPEDIESISVIKGSTAIATYGLRGQNGVIRIISKKPGLF